MEKRRTGAEGRETVATEDATGAASRGRLAPRKSGGGCRRGGRGDGPEANGEGEPEPDRAGPRCGANGGATRREGGAPVPLEGQWGGSRGGAGPGRMGIRARGEGGGLRRVGGRGRTSGRLSRGARRRPPRPSASGEPGSLRGREERDPEGGEAGSQADNLSNPRGRTRSRASRGRSPLPRAAPREAGGWPAGPGRAASRRWGGGGRPGHLPPRPRPPAAPGRCPRSLLKSRAHRRGSSVGNVCLPSGRSAGMRTPPRCPCLSPAALTAPDRGPGRVPGAAFLEAGRPRARGGRTRPGDGGIPRASRDAAAAGSRGRLRAQSLWGPRPAPTGRARRQAWRPPPAGTSRPFVPAVPPGGKPGFLAPRATRAAG